jgi:phage terminase small subunit
MTVLTPKQEKFAQHYALHHNATEAYRSAGYKGNPAHVHRRAIEVLQNRNVSARIEELQERVKNRAEEVFDLTADKLLNQYVRIAFADAGDYYDWDEDGVRIKSKDALTKEQRTIITGLKQSKGNTSMIELSLADRMKAMEMLAKHLRVATEKHDHSHEHKHVVEAAATDLDTGLDQLIARVRASAGASEAKVGDITTH